MSKALEIQVARTKQQRRLEQINTGQLFVFGEVWYEREPICEQLRTIWGPMAFAQDVPGDNSVNRAGAYRHTHSDQFFAYLFCLVKLSSPR